MADVNPTTYGVGAGAEIDEKLREMIDAGVFYGKKKSKTHPKVKQYIAANRGGVEIIDIRKTAEGMEQALGFLRGKMTAGGLVLFVGTQPAAQDAIASVAAAFSQPYVTYRWVGGALTNFKVISGRVEYLKKLRSGMAAGTFDKYTKKERIGIEREIKRLTELMGGLENMTRLPDIVVVIDPKVHITAVREANDLKIPVLALADTDSDPGIVAYPTIGNAKSAKSIAWFLGKIGQVLEEGRRAPSAQAQETASPQVGGELPPNKSSAGQAGNVAASTPL